MPKRIMIVDDQSFIRHVIGSELTQLGYQVSSAVDGEDCIKQLKNSTDFIDLIILDVMMPILNGYDTCKKIRQELKETMPIIFLSANALKSSIITAIQSGGNDYIVKDPDSTKLIQSIKKHIGEAY